MSSAPAPTCSRLAITTRPPQISGNSNSSIAMSNEMVVTASTASLDVTPNRCRMAKRKFTRDLWETSTPFGAPVEPECRSHTPNLCRAWTRRSPGGFRSARPAGRPNKGAAHLTGKRELGASQGQDRHGTNVVQDIRQSIPRKIRIQRQEGCARLEDPEQANDEFEGPFNESPTTSSGDAKSAKSRLLRRLVRKVSVCQGVRPYRIASISGWSLAASKSIRPPNGSGRMRLRCVPMIAARRASTGPSTASRRFPFRARRMLSRSCSNRSGSFSPDHVCRAPSYIRFRLSGRRRIVDGEREVELRAFAGDDLILRVDQRPFADPAPKREKRLKQRVPANGARRPQFPHQRFEGNVLIFVASRTISRTRERACRKDGLPERSMRSGKVLTNRPTTLSSSTDLRPEMARQPRRPVARNIDRAGFERPSAGP